MGAFFFFVIFGVWYMGVSTMVFIEITFLFSLSYLTLFFFFVYTFTFTFTFTICETTTFLFFGSLVRVSVCVFFFRFIIFS